jgi:hypothetical protein
MEACDDTPFTANSMSTRDASGGARYGKQAAKKGGPVDGTAPLTYVRPLPPPLAAGEAATRASNTRRDHVPLKDGCPLQAG